MPRTTGRPEPGRSPGRRTYLVLALLAACKQGGDKPAARASIAANGDGGSGSLDAAAAEQPAGAVVLPPAPPVPTPPAGLPPLPTDHAPTPEEVALGALLFHEPRLAADGATACANCHNPHLGFADHDAHSQTASHKPNLRRSPALVNMAWNRELGWDGRGSDPIAFLDSHAAGQLGHPLDVGLGRLLGSATYRAHFDRTAKGRDRLATATAALWAYVSTRYSGDSPWDRYEAGDTSAVAPEVVEGYKLANGKALCSSCHTPPLYTDLAYHRLGLVATPDEGRGRVDPAQAGSFKTPTLRGVAGHRPFFHDGSAQTLDAAIEWHLAGGRGQGADPSVIDPALAVVTLTPEELFALLSFVHALSPTPDAATIAHPELPNDVPP